MNNLNRFYKKLHKDTKTGKWVYKPKKFLIYIDEIQNKLYSEGKKAAIREINKYNSGRKNGRIVKALAFGSFLHRKMGIYCKDYKGIRHGSDIDVTCISEPEFKAPSHWKNIGGNCYIADIVEKYIPEIENDKKIPLHPINFLIFIPGKDDYSKMRNWIAVDENYSKKLGYPVEIWYKDKKRFDKLKELMK